MIACARLRSLPIVCDRLRSSIGCDRSRSFAIACDRSRSIGRGRLRSLAVARRAPCGRPVRTVRVCFGRRKCGNGPPRWCQTHWKVCRAPCDRSVRRVRGASADTRAATAPCGGSASGVCRRDARKQRPADSQGAPQVATLRGGSGAKQSGNAQIRVFSLSCVDFWPSLEKKKNVRPST